MDKISIIRLVLVALAAICLASKLFILAGFFGLLFIALVVLDYIANGPGIWG